jgi:hypothetical protein
MFDNESLPTPAARVCERREKNPEFRGTELCDCKSGGVCEDLSAASFDTLKSLLDEMESAEVSAVAPSVRCRPGFTATDLLFVVSCSV